MESINTHKILLGTERSVLHQCLPQLGDIEIHRGINLCKVRELDLVLLHASNLLRFAHLGDRNAIVDVKTLSLLLTLAIRIPDINWSAEYTSGNLADSKSTTELQDNYISYPSLRDRAMMIVSSYMKLLIDPSTDGDFSGAIYTAIHTILCQILEGQPTQQTAISDRNLRKRAGKDQDVLTLFASSPKRKSKGAPLTKFENDKATLTHSGTDSKEENKIKFNESLNLMSKFTEMTSTSRSKSKSSSPSYLEPVTFLVFDEPLITDVLNPSKSKGYNMWKLLEWAFYCARLAENNMSTAERHTLKYRKIFRNYAMFLLILVDFLEYDFDLKLKNYLKEMSIDTMDPTLIFEKFPKMIPPSRKRLLNQLLLHKFAYQRTARSIYLYDRTIESIFSCLQNSNPATSYSSCFHKEMRLLGYHNTKNEGSLLSNSFVKETIAIRFRLTYLLYEYALLNSEDSPIDSENRGLFVKNEVLDVFALFEVLGKRLASLPSSMVYLFYLHSIQETIRNEFNGYYLQFTTLLGERILHEMTHNDNLEQMCKILQRHTRKGAKHTVNALLKFINSPFIDNFLLGITINDKSSLRDWTIVNIIIVGITYMLMEWNKLLVQNKKLQANLEEYLSGIAGTMAEVEFKEFQENEYSLSRFIQWIEFLLQND